MANVMELYYRPAPTPLGQGATLVVTDAMIPEVAAAQRAMAASQGFLPVSGELAPPEPAGFFGMWRPAFTRDGGGYSISWAFMARPVRLSRDKILADEAIAPLLPTLAPQLAADEQLARWWTSNLTYVRGSAMAARAMEVLGVARDQLEEIVRRCAG